MYRGRGRGRKSKHNFAGSGIRSKHHGSEEQGEGGGGERSSPSAGFSGSSGQSSSRGRRGGHPNWLKGKDIGLYYASLNKAKKRDTDYVKSESDKQNLINEEIVLNPTRKFKIQGLLDKLKTDSSTNKYDSSHLCQEVAARKEEFRVKFNSNLIANELVTSTKSLFSETESQIKLPRNSLTDELLKKELENKRENAKYNKMIALRKRLPAHKCREDIIDLVSNNQVVVISGETGCGKTTQVGQFLLDHWIERGDGSICNIVCTQPRRISAISVAERVAEERAERIGESIGYSIRLENRSPSRTFGAITFCTTGILFQNLKHDKMMRHVSHIIVDEIHERDVLSDFLLAILKDLIKIRKDLKVILMSATLNASNFSSYFESCPIYTIPGFTFPVTQYYLEDVLSLTNFTFEEGRIKEMVRDKHREFIKMYLRRLEIEKKYSMRIIHEVSKAESEELNLDLIEVLLKHICSTDEKNGAILVFLPGWGEISNLHNQLQNSGRFQPSQFNLIPLHSMMPTVNQKGIFLPSPRGVRKIILATNIAETSITIDDVTHVIDGGRIKMTNMAKDKNLESLDNEWVSLANATQRKGRAGRVQEGFCYHLFTKHREKNFEDYKKPEILRKRLDEVCLQIKILKLGMAEDFLRKLLNPPQRNSIGRAVDCLRRLHAIDDDENLTPLGFHLAQLPMDPQTGKMILMGSIFSCVDPIFSIAASLTFKDAFHLPIGKEKLVDRIRKEMSEGTNSDHFVTVKAIEGYENAEKRGSGRDFCHRNFLSQSTISMLINLKRQFAQYLTKMKFMDSDDYKDPRMNLHSNDVGIIKAMTCAGLYPNVAMMRRSIHSLKTEEDGRVNFHPKSVNSKEKEFDSHYFVYHQKMKSSCIYLHDSTMITPFPLVFFGGELDFIKDKRFSSIGVQGTIRFRCDKDVFEIIQSLRSELDQLLEAKIGNPRPTTWNELTREGALLRAIIELISSDHTKLMTSAALDSSSDSD